MKTIWICLAFAVIGATSTSLNDHDLYYDDYWYEGGDKSSYFDDEKEPLKTDLDENNKNFESENVGTTNSFNDYLVEDNRLNLDENDFESKGTTVREEGEQSSTEILSTSPEVEKKIVTSPDENNENIDLEAVLKDSDEKLFGETTDILNEYTKNDFIDIKPELEDMETNDDLKKIYEETSSILNETEETNDEDDKDAFSDEQIDNNEESNERKDNSSETDQKNVDTDSFNDLMADLETLKKTRDELASVDMSDYDKIEISASDEDYEEIDDANFERLFEDIKNDESDNVEDSKKAQATDKFSEPILYLNDALIDSDNETDTESMKTTETEEVTSTVSTSTPRVHQVEKLSEEEVDGAFEDFTSQLTNIVITSDDVRNAKNIRLTVDTPVVITSPDYPQSYPTDATTDWMFTGDGMGIELNITDFSINGHIGDYLLVKPGGIDESGSTGLLFSYTLRSVRRFRFIDVDQMFVRFEARPGMQFMRGFSFSVRMIAPRPGAVIAEPEPEPVEPVYPVSTITLNLGGISLPEFITVEEDFRRIIADMATMYINSNDIDPGTNTTLETTKITSKALCFHNWPKFERCAEIRFGVPLIYNDDTIGERLNESDLLDMWSTYYQRDPFAVRLRMLGIEEFQIPNDRGVLMVWMVIAGGVLISIALLAFVLWRYSCFAGYTRMPSFSDTDSVNEKRKLDLYPTPHQSLPPLYSEIDYQWADAKYEDTTKVDIGGFSNKSFMQNDVYDIDSDEDARPTRDRSSSFSPRDIYNV